MVSNVEAINNTPVYDKPKIDTVSEDDAWFKKREIYWTKYDPNDIIESDEEEDNEGRVEGEDEWINKQ